MLLVVMGWTDLKAVGGNDTVVLESEGVGGTARSTSIGGAGGNGALNSDCGGFFRASRRP
uniref:Uncharacterized protein n=1 Tax=Romanomermis culicivorax TaxID=13658 RepID=A0A915KSZ6_ROMCU